MGQQPDRVCRMQALSGSLVFFHQVQLLVDRRVLRLQCLVVQDVRVVGCDCAGRAVYHVEVHEFGRECIS